MEFWSPKFGHGHVKTAMLITSSLQAWPKMSRRWAKGAKSGPKYAQDGVKKGRGSFWRTTGKGGCQALPGHQGYHLGGLGGLFRVLLGLSWGLLGLAFGFLVGSWLGVWRLVGRTSDKHVATIAVRNMCNHQFKHHICCRVES